MPVGTSVRKQGLLNPQSGYRYNAYLRTLKRTDERLQIGQAYGLVYMPGCTFRWQFLHDKEWFISYYPVRPNHPLEALVADHIVAKRTFFLEALLDRVPLCWRQWRIACELKEMGLDLTDEL